MASITFSGQLDQAMNEAAAEGNKILFIPQQTVGEVLPGAASELVVESDGLYSITLSYNTYSIYHYSDVTKRRTLLATDIVVSADTAVSTIPDLIGSTVPVTEDSVLTIQGYLTDAQNSATAAATSETNAAASEATVTNRVAAYEVETTEYLIDTFDGSALEVGDVVRTLGYYAAGDAGGAEWVKTGETGTASQSPTDRGENLLNDSQGVEFSLSYYGPLNLNYATGNAETYLTAKTENRLLIGDASNYGGTSGGTETSWLGKTDYVAPNGSLQPGLDWIEINSTSASYASQGAIGFSGAAHSESMSSGAAIGVAGVGVNDNETSGESVNVWALYLDAKRYPDSEGSTWGAEIAVANHGDFVDPYDSSSAKTYGILMAAGADETINGETEDLTYGIAFSNNGASWGCGVSFGASSLRVYTANSESYMKAIVMRNSNQISWESSTGDSWGYIRSNVTSESSETSMLLSDDTVRFRNSSASNIFKITNDGDDYLEIMSKDVNPRIVANGDSTNIDIRLETKGTGTLDLAGGVPFEDAVNSSNFTPDKILTIKVGGSSYKLPVSTGAW